MQQTEVFLLDCRAVTRGVLDCGCALFCALASEIKRIEYNIFDLLASTTVTVSQLQKVVTQLDCFYSPTKISASFIADTVAWKPLLPPFRGYRSWQKQGEKQQDGSEA